MEYKVKVTVPDKKLYPELQEQYCAVPNSDKAMITCCNNGTPLTGTTRDSAEWYIIS